MMNKEWIIYSCGIHALAFAIFHAYFWKLFRWKTGLDQISKPNRAILQIANVQLIYFFIFVAFVCFLFPTESAIRFSSDQSLDESFADHPFHNWVCFIPASALLRTFSENLCY